MEASKLAALLASRICHDLVSPVSSLSMVLDALSDPDMGGQAEEVIGSAARSIEYKLTFLRYALGSVGLQSGAADMHEARKLIEGYMTGYKSKVDWQINAESLTYGQVRLLMNMVMIMAASLPRGGDMRISCQDDAGVVTMSVEGSGPRAKIPADLVSAMDGEEPEMGWMAKNIQPYFARVIAEQLNAKIERTQAEEKIHLVSVVAI